ncbi:MAG: hypothetical protein WCP45_16255 [Verrucomicrobiota bacterium]
MIEDSLSSLLAEWIDSNRPDEFPDSATMPVHVARRDEIRTRPCIVLNTSESKPVPPMQHTARVKLDVHLLSQVDDTNRQKLLSTALQRANCYAKNSSHPCPDPFNLSVC